jgi:hypothetical protein
MNSALHFVSEYKISKEYFSFPKPFRIFFSLRKLVEQALK